jgi:hypothetical protein
MLLFMMILLSLPHKYIQLWFTVVVGSTVLSVTMQCIALRAHHSFRPCNPKYTDSRDRDSIPGPCNRYASYPMEDSASSRLDRKRRLLPRQCHSSAIIDVSILFSGDIRGLTIYPI